MHEKPRKRWLIWLAIFAAAAVASLLSYLPDLITLDLFIKGP
jgi:hypothetical protein